MKTVWKATPSNINNTAYKYSAVGSAMMGAIIMYIENSVARTGTSVGIYEAEHHECLKHIMVYGI